MKDGILLIDKPAGITSHDVTNVVGDIQNLDILKTLEEKTGVHLELVVP